MVTALRNCNLSQASGNHNMTKVKLFFAFMMFLRFFLEKFAFLKFLLPRNKQDVKQALHNYTRKTNFRLYSMKLFLRRGGGIRESLRGGSEIICPRICAKVDRMNQMTENIFLRTPPGFK